MFIYIYIEKIKQIMLVSTCSDKLLQTNFLFIMTTNIWFYAVKTEPSNSTYAGK